MIIIKQESLWGSSVVTVKVKLNQIFPISISTSYFIT